MWRITIKFLQAQCDRLNRMTDSPMVPYINSIAQIGNYHIGHACGGYCLQRIMNTSGGVHSVLTGWHIPARQLSELISAYISGLNDAQEPEEFDAREGETE